MGKEQTLSRLNSVAELEAKRESIIKSRAIAKPGIFICGGTGCLALGAESVVAAFEEEIKKHGIRFPNNYKELLTDAFDKTFTEALNL